MKNVSPSTCIELKEGTHVAKVVLMPGDPLRAKYIAEHYLENPVLFNDIRNMLGYTGTYEGREISVMGSGMGMPSFTLYAYELFRFFDVEAIIRIGSAGALSEKLHLMDIVAAMSVYTDSNYGDQFGIRGHMAPCCSYELLSRAVEAGKKLGREVVCGPVYSSDVFYDESKNSVALRKLGVLAVEMEASALYLNAARAGKNALCICTISDSVVTGESLPAEQRQIGFREMMEIALDIA